MKKTLFNGYLTEYKAHTIYVIKYQKNHWIAKTVTLDGLLEKMADYGIVIYDHNISRKAAVEMVNYLIDIS